MTSEQFNLINNIISNKLSDGKKFLDINQELGLSPFPIYQVYKNGKPCTSKTINKMIECGWFTKEEFESKGVKIEELLKGGKGGRKPLNKSKPSKSEPSEPKPEPKPKPKPESKSNSKNDAVHKSGRPKIKKSFGKSYYEGLEEGYNKGKREGYNKGYKDAKDKFVSSIDSNLIEVNSKKLNHLISLISSNAAVGEKENALNSINIILRKEF